MLPLPFSERMKRLLGEEYPAFLRAMTEEPSVHALRINTVLPTADPSSAIGDLSLRRVPYTDDGYYYDGGERIGHHPAHHAGIVYSQDPGAMSTLNAVSIPRGARVLDVCAAPGGKSAQLAAAIGPEGLLVSNEYVTSRCRILVSNIERLAIPNALVLHEDSTTLAQQFPSFFDLVLVDAPCSGEGMFRKSEEALADWSEENVRISAARQREILKNAAATVRPGGRLLYSTCTFSREENEECIADFLASNPQFSILPVKERLIPYTAAGLLVEGCPHPLHLTRRFYPHIAPGEGQYMALLARAQKGEAEDTPAYRDASATPTKGELALLSDFFKKSMGDSTPAARVRTLGGKLLLPPPIPLPPFGVFAAGTCIGEIRGKNFFPHHQLFKTHGCRFLRKIELTPDDPRTAAYLHGDVIAAPDTENGYAAVLLCGAPLGGAKIVDGVAKNLYPKGLRNLK